MFELRHSGIQRFLNIRNQREQFIILIGCVQSENCLISLKIYCQKACYVSKIQIIKIEFVMMCYCNWSFSFVSNKLEN